MAVPGRKPRRRHFNIRSLSHAIAGPEQAYPTYQFSRKVFRERPRHDPFIEPVTLALVEPAGSPFEVTVDEVMTPLDAYTVSNGTGPYSFTDPDRTLAKSMGISTGGIISGTPTIVGLSEINIRGFDSLGNVGFNNDILIDVIAAGVPPVSGPDGCNILAESPNQVGFTFGVSLVGNPTFGTNDNIFPEPPDVSPLEFIRCVQKSDFTWEVRFEATVAEFAWTSLTLSSVLSTVVVLTANNTQYTANSFGQTIWQFAATAPCWRSEAEEVTAVFA